MRIWDISPKILCSRHLIAEHGELHSLWSIIINGKKGFSRHPETMRWRGKLNALYQRHEELAREIKRRGYQHNSPLDKKQASGKSKQDKFINTKVEQKIILKKKDCRCPLNN